LTVKPIAFISRAGVADAVEARFDVVTDSVFMTIVTFACTFIDILTYNSVSGVSSVA